MNISLIRVDERLIHGQVMTAWVKKCWIKKIILIDNELANDDFMREVLPMSAPSGVKVEVRTVDDAYNVITADESDESTLILFKEIKYAYEFYKTGYKYKELDIGNVGSSAIRKAITREVYLSETEKDMCRELNQNGIHVYIQKLPQDNQVDVMEKI